MHTETNVLDSSLAPGWLYKEWANMLRLRDDGIPILGFTWYSLTDQIGEAYRQLIHDWRDILPTGSTGLQMPAANTIREPSRHPEDVQKILATQAQQDKVLPDREIPR